MPGEALAQARRGQEHVPGRAYPASLGGDVDAAAWRKSGGRQRGVAPPVARDDRALRQSRQRHSRNNRAALAGERAMLIDDARRYIALHRSLGFKLEQTARHLATFTRHAVD